MTVRGRVERRRVGHGSKSEHDAVVLVADAGVYTLRRRGGHAFEDPALDALVGKSVEFDGALLDNTLHVTDWREIPA
jgi:hypothetical protein